MLSHRMTGTDFYKVWKNMRTRINNPNRKDYPNYGGRGIKICERWQTFENFKEDMFDDYAEGLSIERIDNDRDYEPSNCRWATKQEQNWNRRFKKLSPEQVRSIRAEYVKGNGMKLAEKYGVSHGTIYEILNRRRNYAHEKHN